MAKVKSFSYEEGDTTPEDGSRPILNAVEPRKVLPIHRYRTSTGTIVMLREKVVQHYYDDSNRTASIVLASNTNQVAMSVPVGQWHALVSLEEENVIFECKDRGYVPLAKVYFFEISRL